MLDLSLRTFFQRLAGPDAPGSGSCAAVTALAGVSLMEMAARLGGVDGAPLSKARGALEELLPKDAEVLAEVLPLLKEIGPDGNSGEWNDALVRAAQVPLAVAESALAALQWAAGAAGRMPLPLVCDLKCAALSCHAGLQSAVLLAELNASLLRDDDALAVRLAKRAADASEAAGALLDGVLAK